jgi:hypothetical protein
MASHIGRRKFLATLGAAAAWPLGAPAQQPDRMRRIGVLMGLVANDPEAHSRVVAFENGLRELGWVKERNLSIDYRWAGDGNVLRDHAAELLAMAPDLILANSTPVTTACQSRLWRAAMRRWGLTARNEATASPTPILHAPCTARWSGIVRCAGFSSLQLQHDCAFRDSWSGHTSFAGILGDPLPCCPTALVGTSLVLVDRDREPSASGAHERIAHETLYPPDETFHFSFVLLQEVEKRLRAFAGIASNDSMHDTPPPADVLHVNAAGT